MENPKRLWLAQDKKHGNNGRALLEKQDCAQMNQWNTRWAFMNRAN